MNNTTTHPRERLVKTAANLVHRQGWTITGINQILTEAGIPKGSFYYYFRSKEALGVAVLQLHHTTIKSLLEKTLLNTSLSADIAIADFIGELRHGALAEEYRFGCPAGNLANEAATQSPALLAEALRALDLYRDAWLQLIRRAQSKGMVSADRDAAELARTASILLQGAFLTAKCAGNSESLDLAHNVVHRLLFGAEVKASASSRFNMRDSAPNQAMAS